MIRRCTVAEIWYATDGRTNGKSEKNSRESKKTKKMKKKTTWRYHHFTQIN